MEESSNPHGSVKVILDQKADPQNEGDSTTYITSKTHQVLRPDHVIMSSGIKSNSQFMVKNFAHCLDEHHFIKVDEYFQVNGQTHMFAIGDVGNFSDPKLYFTAHMQAIHLSKNLKAMLNGNPPTPYKGSRISYAISLGPERGLFSLMDGLVNIRGFRSYLHQPQHGSRLGSFIKQLIKKVSLHRVTISITSHLLYYLSTK